MKALIVVLFTLCFLGAHCQTVAEKKLVNKELNAVAAFKDMEEYLILLGQGFAKGIQNDPTKDISSCTTDLLKIGDVFDALEKIITDVKTGQFNIFEMVTFVMNTYRIALDIDADCHFIELIDNIGGFLNPVTLIVRLGQIVLRLHVIIPAYFRMLFSFFWTNDPFQAGLQLGILTRSILDFGIEGVRANSMF